MVFILLCGILFLLICSAKNYVFIIFEFDLCHPHFINIKQTFISTFSDIHTFIYSSIQIRTAFIFVLSFISPFILRFACIVPHTNRAALHLSLSLSHPSLYVFMPRRHTIPSYIIHIHYARPIIVLSATSNICCVCKNKNRFIVTCRENHEYIYYIHICKRISE